MSCSCEDDSITIPLTSELREYVPGNAQSVLLCQSCLAIDPNEEPSDSVPDLTALDDAIPRDTDTAVAFVVLVGLLDSVALYRTEITALLERIERAGTDPLLALDRLAASYGDDAHVDLSGRRRQLEQLL
jgi:hypothetical protein